MTTVAFHTLGCKVNQYETEAMMELFAAKGYSIVDFDQKADVYVINTCTVTNFGDKKSRQMIRRAKKQNPDGVMAVVGCYAQVAPEEVMGIDGVNMIIGTNDRHRIVERVEAYQDEQVQVNLVTDIMQVREFEELSVANLKDRTRAYLKIQEGCNQYCAYCIIPYARGPIRSRKPEDVVKEVEQLVKNGFKEIVLAGIHVASYGKDLGDIDLLKIIEMVHTMEGLERIRLSSIEPTILTEDFVERLAQLPKVCEHFHLSLQSGCDETLKRMNRKYTTDQYKIVVKRLRKIMPQVAITTDIIVGFPGETEEEYEQTYGFVKEIGFSQIHVFKFSPKEGTPAAKRKDQIDPGSKEIRSNRMIELGEQMEHDFLGNYQGQTLEVLFEEKDGKGCYEGYTRNYVKVLVASEKDLKNQLVTIRITEIKNDHVLGEIVIA